MKLLDNFVHLFVRWKYPVSLPQDIAEALGVEVSNFVSFNEFVTLLTSPNCKPKKLCKFMPREQAEEAFGKALKKEIFKHNSLFSYYFSEGWLEFSLLFDDDSRLRRIYIQHKFISCENGIEIYLERSHPKT